jgi:4-hydroxybenzoyl-CoA reductase subunit beta
MLPLPRFEFVAPRSLAELRAHLDRHAADSLLVAGGTDAVPNLKHRLYEPRYVVHLGGLAELRGVREEDGELRIGALVTLSELTQHPRVRERLPSLAKAASLVAGPQLRNMGTVGGNLCLDTRCTYFNQTYFWRRALGFCLKKDGTRCHVVPAGRRCVAAHSSDTAPVLITLDARAMLDGRDGRRQVAVRDFFVPDGLHNNVLAPGEVVLEVRVPLPGPGWHFGYQKLRPRQAIDFPMLSVAFAAKLGDRGACQDARLVISALAAAPRVVAGLHALRGGALDEVAVARLVELAYRQCHPVMNVPYDTDYRREMVPVLVRRAVAEALHGAAA